MDQQPAVDVTETPEQSKATVTETVKPKRAPIVSWCQTASTMGRQAKGKIVKHLDNLRVPDSDPALACEVGRLRLHLKVDGEGRDLGSDAVSSLQERYSGAKGHPGFMQIKANDAAKAAFERAKIKADEARLKAQAKN